MSINLGLERIAQLLSSLPAYTRPTIHIAGTNGKGSVTSIIESILRHSGFTTGKFTSPHLITVRDSISLNGCEISAETYETASGIVRRADTEHAIGASNFEILTAVALYVFEQAAVDVVVLEVGMGGRLDATNAIPEDTVLICGLTSVDLDHQAFLGNTIQEITREKAAIAKKGRCMVVGEQRHAEVYDVAEEVVQNIAGIMARAKRATRRQWDERLDGPTPPPFTISPLRPPPPQPISFQTSSPGTIHALFSLQGEHQIGNVSLAVDIVDRLRQYPPWNKITDAHISQGIQNVHWPGRLQWSQFSQFDQATGAPLHTTAILADGAHNPASATVLSRYIDSLDLPTSPRTFILSLSHSPPKTPKATLEPLLRPGDHVIVVPFSPVEDMPWVKPVDMTILAEEARKLISPSGTVSVKRDVEVALNWCAEQKVEWVVVAGSLYLVADLYRSSWQPKSQNTLASPQ